MKAIDFYLKLNGIDISEISGEEYHKLEELHTSWAINNNCATMALNEKSYSPYSTDYRYVQFQRAAETSKALLEDEVAKIKNRSRKRK